MDINRLTVEEVRAIGTKYGIRMTGKVGSTWDRVVVFATYVMLLAYASDLIVGLFEILFELELETILELTATLVVTALAFTVRYFVVNVPKFSGLLTTNLLRKGEIHVFEPGLGIKFPWEGYSKDDFINTRVDDVTMETTFLTKDKQEVTYDWGIHFAAVLRLLPFFVRTEISVITSDFQDIAITALSTIFSSKDLEELGTPEMNAEIRKTLNESLEQARLKDTRGSTMEERFAIRVEMSTLSAPRFQKDRQEAYTARGIRKIIVKDAKDMANDLGIDPGEALDNVMILNKEGVKKTVFGLHGKGVAEVLAGAAKDAGDIARAVTAVAGANQPKGKGKGK